MITYTVEVKNSRRGAWKVLPRQTTTNRDTAISFATDLDEHGNVVRVRSRGHSDGFDRTEFCSITR